MTAHFDDAVVGAGIIGLAHAYHLASRGRRVAVFERSPRACGASIRNFGMLWPIGQPAGSPLRLALRSREIWLEVLRAAEVWHDAVGSLHLAYHDDEAAVLAQFAERAGDNGYRVDLLNPEDVRRKSPFVRSQNLVSGLWSETEICVDPRAVIARLPEFLSARFAVQFFFGAAVTGYHDSHVRAGGHSVITDRLWVCSGADLETLYPEALGSAGLVPCKLQMMRTAPTDQRLGPMLAAGLTLLHYKSFAACPGLGAVRERVARERSEYVRYGIHVMTSQNETGEIVIGDSHEYGDSIGPFDNAAIDKLILDYLDTFVALPQRTIAARWNGVYVKHPSEPYVVLNPEAGVTATVGVGGAGMTLSFGVAEEVVAGQLRN
jgi:FAD dependent oxidoreductase TIGR03364